MNLCDRFPALTPFQVRREKATEVFLMLRRIERFKEIEERNKGRNGKKVIRRPAGDNWF